MYTLICKTGILVFCTFSCLFCNGQKLRNHEKDLTEGKNIFLLSYLTSEPTLRFPNRNGLDTLEYERLTYYFNSWEEIIFIEFDVETLDVFFTKKAFEEYLSLLEISYDSLPQSNGHYMVNMKYKAVIIYFADSRKKMKRVKKEYEKLKESYNRKFPIIFGMQLFNNSKNNSLQTSTYYYLDYYYIMDFNYFDKLIKVE